MAAQLVWFRRDLRVRDHPALVAAAAAGEVLPVFVADPAFAGAGAPRTAALRTALRALHEATDGALVVRSGRPEEVIPALVREAGADAVHVSGESTPYGRRRDARVEAALDVPLVATGSPYAVTPGRVRKGDGSPFRVFTPFSRAWLERGWRAPAERPSPRWVRRVEGEPLPEPPETSAGLSWASEEGARERWATFLDGPIDDYDAARDRPDLDGTSRLSIALKLGTVHPRTLLADLDAVAPRRSRAAQRSLKRFQAELAWREFYADVLLHHPRSAWRDLGAQLRGIAYDEPGQLFEAWCAGRTGFPFVDAGMRQLLAEGWMHNRVRMVTASFLTKDLHVWWPYGARFFLEHLADGDLASNSHGWQWTAGTGTDAAPYFRVFNPVLQGQRYDPDGDYVRRWVPELRHIPGAAVHEPWKVPVGLAHGYPQRILDHAVERREALDRLAAVSA
ncbi:deoxyribodipyrimidine photo-lyase [Agrococcus sp. Marseille-Q4369]|uniref:cryptochrome/photolyase family protein n=1 Tax=Agrococcus sp. Marseille-Q4369 TaxID=2810513 RepID=UPI001B8CE340|nr:deoxyribodipyrimidine photo-lyase [Agrococcus sp. Marseille-Q4369]QUW18199.1 deoxyribodipyrimidine photo-lyase [Agrococcus sp. Marseille-Q4369]